MKTFKSYLIPSVIAQVFMSAYAIVDGIFIGFRLGDTGLAAINIAWPVTAFLQSFGLAFGISAGIFLTRMEARGEDKNRFKGGILIILLGLSLLLGGTFYAFRKPLMVLFQAKGETLDGAVEYITIILYGCVFQVMGSAMIPLLKNVSRVKEAMLASLLATATNLVLDYILIFVVKWGLTGAAIASVAAQAASFVFCFVIFIKNTKCIYVKEGAIREYFLGMAAPFILNYSSSLLLILTNVLCERLGGDAAVASYTVLSYMLYVVNAVAQGSGDAIQPLFSYHSECKEYRINYRYLFLCILVAGSIILLFDVFFYFLRNPIGHLYGLSTEALGIYQYALWFYLIGFVFIAVSKVICSYFYSVNRKGLANLLVLAEPLLLTPLCYLILIASLALNGLWISFLIVQILLFVLAIVFFFLSRRHENERIFHRRQASGNDIPDGMHEN